ncbi:MAG: hypothetical protein V4606_00365 [Patescibacteria group bacterium]
MFTTTQAFIKLPFVYGRKFAFVREGEADIFLPINIVLKSGFQVDELKIDATVELEYETDKFGRYRATMIHEVDGKLSTQLYRCNVVDRHGDLAIIKVVDITSFYAIAYRVIDKEGCKKSSHPTLAAARASIGRVIETPQAVGHGRKTNVIKVMEDKKKKAA